MPRSLEVVCEENLNSLKIWVQPHEVYVGTG